MNSDDNTVRRRSVDDAEMIVSWVPDADALHLFTGARLQWPLTTQQLIDLEVSTGYSAWTFLHNGVPTGHFDLTVHDENAGSDVC